MIVYCQADRGILCGTYSYSNGFEAYNLQAIQNLLHIDNNELETEYFEPVIRLLPPESDHSSVMLHYLLTPAGCNAWTNYETQSGNE